MIKKFFYNLLKILGFISLLCLVICILACTFAFGVNVGHPLIAVFLILLECIIGIAAFITYDELKYEKLFKDEPYA